MTCAISTDNNSNKVAKRDCPSNTEIEPNKGLFCLEQKEARRQRKEEILLTSASPIYPHPLLPLPHPHRAYVGGPSFSHRTGRRPGKTSAAICNIHIIDGKLQKRPLLRPPSFQHDTIHTTPSRPQLLQYLVSSQAARTVCPTRAPCVSCRHSVSVFVPVSVFMFVTP